MAIKTPFSIKTNMQFLGGRSNYYQSVLDKLLEMKNFMQYYLYDGGRKSLEKDLKSRKASDGSKIFDPIQVDEIIKSLDLTYGKVLDDTLDKILKGQQLSANEKKKADTSISDFEMATSGSQLDLFSQSTTGKTPKEGRSKGSKNKPKEMGLTPTEITGEKADKLIRDEKENKKKDTELLEDIKDELVEQNDKKDDVTEAIKKEKKIEEQIEKPKLERGPAPEPFTGEGLERIGGAFGEEDFEQVNKLMSMLTGKSIGDIFKGTANAPIKAGASAIGKSSDLLTGLMRNKGGEEDAEAKKEKEKPQPVFFGKGKKPGRDSLNMPKNITKMMKGINSLVGFAKLEKTSRMVNLLKDVLFKGLSLATNPFVIAAAAIGSLVTAIHTLVENWGGIKEILNEKFQGFIDSIKGLGSLIANSIKGLLGFGDEEKTEKQSEITKKQVDVEVAQSRMNKFFEEAPERIRKGDSKAVGTEFFKLKKERDEAIQRLNEDIGEYDKISGFFDTKFDKVDVSKVKTQESEKFIDLMKMINKGEASEKQTLISNVGNNYSRTTHQNITQTSAQTHFNTNMFDNR